MAVLVLLLVLLNCVYLKIISNATMKTSVFSVSEEFAASDHCTLLTVAHDQYTTWRIRSRYHRQEYQFQTSHGC
ncbi:hypothetical protein BDR22DRAFT_829533 [Usnea florida]